MTTAPEAIDSESVETAASETPELPPPTLLDAAHEWWLSLRTTLARAADIAVLEARLAALNFVLILIIAVASGLLLATAWIALFGAIVACLHEMGLSWSLAMLLVAAVNFALAAIGGYTIYRMSNNLLFKAIRKFIVYGKDEMSGARDADSGSAAGNTPPAS